MRNKQNHIKKVSIIHLNNHDNNQDIKIYQNKTKNVLNKQQSINININNTPYNTINEINKVSRRINRPKININENKIERVNTDITEQKTIYKREINLNNKNENYKTHLGGGSDNIQLSSNNYSITNTFKKNKISYKNNSSLHIINQNKNENEKEKDREINNNKETKKLSRNHSIVFISGTSKDKNNDFNKNFTKNFPKLDIIKAGRKSNGINYIKKAETIDRSLNEKDKLKIIKEIRNKNQNKEKEENKIKFSRRLEVTEKTEVLLPNQTFKPLEQFEKKEDPIIEIKNNKDGTTTKTIKEILIKTTIENSLINAPNINFVKKSQKETILKQKITKEYITTIKFYSNTIDSNDNNNNNSKKLEIKNNEFKINNDKKLINEGDSKNNKRMSLYLKNRENMINDKKEIKTIINNKPNIEIGTNGLENNNNKYKNNMNEKNKKNIKNTVYSNVINVINNNINKPHKRGNNSNINKSKIILKNSNKNYNTISNVNIGNGNIDNGNNSINQNINKKEINYRYNKNGVGIYENSKNIKSMNNNGLLTQKDLQILSDESQLLSNTINANCSLNSISINDSKASSKILFDIPFNSDELEEKIEKSEKRINNTKMKYEKLNEFINKLNNDLDKFDINNNDSKEDKNKLLENQNEEKIKYQKQISNLSLKEYEENENDGENTNNKNITGSIMYINSNIDKNIHIQNGLENYSINIDGNSLIDNFNIIETESVSYHKDHDFIESIKNKINYRQKKESDYEQDILKDINNIDEKVEEKEYDIGKEEKFYKPLNKYENKFNLEQINPF